jgi:hypothetical protein
LTGVVVIAAALMKLLCFQAKRFRWKSYSKSIPDAPDQEVEEEITEGLVVFLQVEPFDVDGTKRASVTRKALKHIKWLANKRSLKNIVLHSFAHLGENAAGPAPAQSFLTELAGRLEETDYRVWLTPFGYFCEWDLSVYGDSLAKVWKEID